MKTVQLCKKIEDREYLYYDYIDGEICFVSTANKPYHRMVSDDVIRLLYKIQDNDYHLLENELVALNKYIMHRDIELDLNNIKSKQTRSIIFSESLKQFLYDTKASNRAAEPESGVCDAKSGHCRKTAKGK